MPNNETLGASFSIDVTQLKAGLAQANRLIRESESEFKAAAAGMDDWRESQEGLQARIKHLNTACDLQRKKVDALQGEYDRLIADGLDPTSAAAVKLRTDINKEKEALAKNEKEIEQQTQALEELGDAAEEAADATKKAGDAAEDAGDGFTVAKGAIAGFISNGLSALVGAAKDAISSVLGLAESTREYRTELAKIETAASEAGASTDYIKKKWHDMGAVLGDEGAVGEGLNNLLAAGYTTEEEMDAITQHLEGAAIKWKDTLKFEGLSDGLQETLATGAAVGSFGEMLERSGVDLEKFNAGLEKCKTKAEQQNYVLQQLSGLGLADVSAAYREQNKDLIEANKSQARHAELTAQLGEKIEPITTKVRDGFNSILEKVLELTEGVDMEAFGEKIDAAFAVFIDEVIPAIVDGLTWIVDNKDGVIAGIVGIGAAFAAFKVVSLIQGVISALQGMTVAQAALNLVMSMNPIGLVVAAVAGLVAAFAVLWKKCDAFREFWINLWEGIKTAFGVVVEWVKENWDTMLLALVNPLGAIFKYCYEHFEGFRNFVDNIVASVKQFFSNMWQGLTDGAKSAWQGVKDTFSKVASFFSDIFSKAWQGVKNVFSAGGKIFDGIKDGIVSAFKTVVNAIIRGINKVVKLPFEGLNGILDKLTGLSIAGIKPFDWLTWRAPVPQLPMLATGGVVKKATAAVIGEDGAEAVVPLEKNTGWIKKLAAEIAAQQQQSVVVNQTNNYSQAHSRVELYKTKQATAAAVRLAMAGA